MPKLRVFNIEVTKIISYYFLNMAPRTLELVCVVCELAFHLQFAEQFIKLRILSSGLSKSYCRTFCVEKGKFIVL